MTTTNEAQQKPIHSLVLDTGPLIKNAVSISTIINSAEELYTTPSILSEIRDQATRSRVQTTLMPFLKVRTPRPASYDAVIAFSRKTGDHAVLSRQDLGILALAYEIHCERNSGDWGLRDTPGQPVKRRPGEGAEKKEGGKDWTEVRKNRTKSAKQAAPEIEAQPVEEDGWEMPRGKRVIKSKPTKLMNVKDEPEIAPEEHPAQAAMGQTKIDQEIDQEEEEGGGGGVILQDHFAGKTPASESIGDGQHSLGDSNEDNPAQIALGESISQRASTEAVGVKPEYMTPSTHRTPPQISEAVAENTEPFDTPADALPDITDLTISSSSFPPQQPTPPLSDSSDLDSDGDWITPSNLLAHQAQDSGIESHSQTAKATQLDIATMTIDFAMQNVLLQMNLHLLSTNMQRIKHLSTKVLRCHACFNIVKQMDKEFCPRCGQSSLQRVSCSTNAKGEFRIHLSKNYQWNTRGDKYSIPKPTHGTANGKWSGQGGGKGGWGRDLILAEDQKEYQRQMDQDKRTRTRDLMDEDYLPSILTGDRGKAGGRAKVGAGKNVNSRKR